MRVNRFFSSVIRIQSDRGQYVVSAGPYAVIRHPGYLAGIVVVVAHRPSAIAGVDYILVMAKGRQQQFGPKEEILNRVIQPPTAPRALKVVPEQQGGAG